MEKAVLCFVVLCWSVEVFTKKIVSVIAVVQISESASLLDEFYLNDKFLLVHFIFSQKSPLFSLFSLFFY